MDPTEYLLHLDDDGSALAAAARQAPHGTVPSCPGWSMSALLGHTSTIHRWVTAMVRSRASERLSRRTLPPPPDDPAAVLAWYAEGLADLTAALKDMDPDQPMWNWSPDEDRRARFWYRRMAQETAVHRWDAQAAAESVTPVDAALAVDGIDEYFQLFLAAHLRQQPVAALHGSLHLHATDVPGEWWLALSPDHVEQRHEHAKADAAVRGPASELLLWLWNRRPSESPELQVFGNPAIVDHFRTLAF